MNVKIYGERNTGTTVLEQLIKRNSTARLIPGTAVEIDPGFKTQLKELSKRTAGGTKGLAYTVLREALADRIFSDNLHETLGWKHAAPSYELLANQQDTLFLFMIKNPYSWLLSLARRPYHCFLWNSMNLTEFVKHPWVTVGRELTPPLLQNPVELWNYKVNSYLETAEKLKNKNNNHCCFIKYEDFVADQELASRQVLDLVGHKQNNFIVIEEASKEIDRESGRNVDYYRNYYLNESWRQSLDSETLHRINQYLNLHLLDTFGYQKLE